MGAAAWRGHGFCLLDRGSGFLQAQQARRRPNGAQVRRAEIRIGVAGNGRARIAGDSPDSIAVRVGFGGLTVEAYRCSSKIIAAAFGATLIGSLFPGLDKGCDKGCDKVLAIRGVAFALLACESAPSR